MTPGVGATGTRRPNGRSAKNAAKCGEKPITRTTRGTSRRSTNPSARRTKSIVTCVMLSAATTRDHHTCVHGQFPPTCCHRVTSTDTSPARACALVTSANVDKGILADVRPGRRRSAQLCVENAFLRHSAKDGNLFHCVLLNATEAPKIPRRSQRNIDDQLYTESEEPYHHIHLFLNLQHRSKAMQIRRHQNVISQKNPLSKCSTGKEDTEVTARNEGLVENRSKP